MPCYSPLRAWRSKTVNQSGKRSLVFDRKDGFDDLEVIVPCGQCIGCRLERSRQWAIRCVHEASLYDRNCFLTLTYSEEHLPRDGSLHVDHFQKFMKRLRKRYGSGIRFFHCGEYGEQNNRPHYHACIFNHDFDDKVLWTIRDGIRLYTSESLHELWPFGYCVIGDVTFDSAAYVARYITKKITGDRAAEHYGDLKPEYITMSRRPGIGQEWFDLFQDDLFPHDRCVINGKEVNIPKYYRTLHELEDSAEHRRLKSLRMQLADLHKKDTTLIRLRDREVCKKSQISLLKRGYENET